MRGSFDTSHLRKGEDVGHASANPGIQGTTEIGLPVRAQESKADARLRPGREGDERVEVGVEGTAQVFVVPGGVHDCSPTGTYPHRST